MKRMYNQPVVEATEMYASSLMQTSPGLNVSETPIPDNGGGD